MKIQINKLIQQDQMICLRNNISSPEIISPLQNFLEEFFKFWILKYRSPLISHFPWQTYLKKNHGDEPLHILSSLSRVSLCSVVRCPSIVCQMDRRRQRWRWPNCTATSTDKKWSSIETASIGIFTSTTSIQRKSWQIMARFPKMLRIWLYLYRIFWSKW